MTPKRKVVFLILGLILPFAAMATYFVFVLSGHPGIVFPGWYAYAICLYIFGSVVLVMVVLRRISGRTRKEQTERTRRKARAFAMYLIVVWSLCFCYGVYKTLKGELPLAGAVRGGAVLVAFIVLFSWALYRDFNRTGR